MERSAPNGGASTRRDALRAIVGSAAAAGLVGGGIVGSTRPARAEDEAGTPPSGSSSSTSQPGLRSGLRITRVSAFTVVAPRWKLVGKNSQLGDHGRNARDRILRIETNAGIEGVGSCFASKEDAGRLIGRDPLDFWRPGTGIESPLGRGDAPLIDLIGRFLDKPAWLLFGGFGPERVPAYDGSIYFADLIPEHASRPIERILEEVDHALARGHRGFKVKVGRGAKWMEREAGFARDVEVVRAILKHVGPKVRVGVDANNGMDLETTKRFIDAVEGELWFVEEMFPEKVEEDLALKAFLRERGLSTLVADGESAHENAHFDPFIEHRALDVLQGDIRTFGFTLLRELSRRTAQTPIRLAPHNWGSYLGLYMQLTLGRGIPNFLVAEEDPGKSGLFDAEGFELRDGAFSVPDAPGLGVRLRADRLADLANHEWTVEA